MARIKVFNTPNTKEQNFLNHWEWDLVTHPKFPIPNLSFTHKDQPEHFKRYLLEIMNPNEFNISFFGSGDYHYLCLPILELCIPNITFLAEGQGFGILYSLAFSSIF